MELQEYWGAGGRRRRCGRCEAAPAAVHCRTCVVGSYLCTACDALPAHALQGHDRVWMSELVPTAVACEADGAVLSATCDADIDIHGANPLARRHALVPVAPIGSEAATAAVEAMLLGTGESAEAATAAVEAMLFLTGESAAASEAATAAVEAMLFGTGESAAASEADELDVAAEQQLKELLIEVFVMLEHIEGFVRLEHLVACVASLDLQHDIFSPFGRQILRLGKLVAGHVVATGELKFEAERIKTAVSALEERALGNKPFALSLAHLKEFMHGANAIVDRLELKFPMLQLKVQGMLAPAVEPEGMVGDGADASAPANIGRKNRSKERDYFHITPAVNGEPVKAKCIDCGTKVVFSHGTSVLRKHRNSARCKNKRAAIEEEPNYPSPYSTQNGAIISTNASEGTKWMSELVPTAIACEADGAVLSATCDADIHGANPLARDHARVPVAPIDSDAATAAVEAMLLGTGVDEAFLKLFHVINGWAVGNKPQLPAGAFKYLKMLLSDATDVFYDLKYFSLELKFKVGDGAEHADASAPDNIGRKNRCKEWDYFHITPAVNGEPAKAKCIDCGTQVLWGHGTSVLRKHRNSARCKNKRAAIEEEPNYPSPYSTQNGAIISTNASEGTKRMTTNVATITLEWIKDNFLERINEAALEFGCIRDILESRQPGQLNAWLDRAGIACATKERMSEVKMMEMRVVVHGRAVGNEPLAHSPVRVEQLDYLRLQHQAVQGGMLSPAIEPEGMDGEEDSDEANAVGVSSSSTIPNKRGRKNRSEAWDFFQLMPAVNGEAAKAKCVDCGTEVQCGHGTSVLHKHRNSASCKRNRAAIEVTSNSSRNGAHF